MEYLKYVNGRLMDGADHRPPSVYCVPHSPAGSNWVSKIGWSHETWLEGAQGSWRGGAIEPARSFYGSKN